MLTAGPYITAFPSLQEALKNNTPIFTKSRACTIVPNFVGLRFGVVEVAFHAGAVLVIELLFEGFAALGVGASVRLGEGGRDARGREGGDEENYESGAMLGHGEAPSV